MRRFHTLKLYARFSGTRKTRRTELVEEILFPPDSYRHTAFHGIARLGMQAEIRGRKMLGYCKEVMEVAAEHLKSFAVLNEKKEDESVYLAPMKDFVFVKEKSPGEWVMQQWDDEWRRNPEKLIEWCSFDVTAGR